jgi:hypothetical protein
MYVPCNMNFVVLNLSGGSGFDPPRWFGETSTLPDE